MPERIRCHPAAQCYHNNLAVALPPALASFYQALAQAKPAIIWPSDWSGAQRQPLDLSGIDADTFYIGFTSGSTGQPKAFFRNHQSWLASFACLPKAPNAVLATGDLSHSLHLFAGVYATHHGCQFYSYDRFSSSAIGSVLAEIDWLFTTPSQLRVLCRDGEPSVHLSHIWVSGAALQSEDLMNAQRKFPNAQVRQFYGASETSFIAIADGDTPPGSVGRPSDIGVQIQIDDHDRIWVASPMNFSGYLAPQFQRAEPWVSVDDCGYLDDQGYLYVQGRRQRMINTAGLNVYPEEIEQALRRHPDVSDATVIGLPCRLRGEKVAALVATQIDVAELKQWLGGRIGRHSQPKIWQRCDQLPYNRAGKPDLRSIYELLSG